MAKTNNNAAQAKGQKNLFSFFAKKPSASKPAAAATKKSSAAPASAGGAPTKKNNDTTSKPAAAAQPTTKQTPTLSRPSNNNSVAQPTPSHLKQLQKITVGTKLAVYWPDDQEYYPCVVTRHRVKADKGDPGHMYTINYEDGEIETVDLAKEKFRIIGGVKRSSEGTDNTAKAASAKKDANSNNKRRRILEDSEDDEEMEFESEEEQDDDGNDTGSEFKMNDDESMDDSLDADMAVEEGGDDTDNWLASEDDDDEDNVEEKKPKSVKKKKVLKVTKVGGGGNDRGRFVSPTPRKVTGSNTKKSSANDMSTMDFSNFASQSPTHAHGNDTVNKKSPMNNSKSNNSPVPQTNSNSTTNNATATKHAPPKPIAGVVNSAGSHLHNHLKFFTTNRKDGLGHSTTHPNYSPRTLEVAFSEIERESGSKVSPAQKQWWDIKSQYADSVLLFKTGKFYEMFHDDADVGVKVLGFVYMKGTLAHAGFPEAAYDKMLTKLVDAGYSVARVEQTETPDALKERKKKAPTGKKPQVVCREVCGIVTKGTKTFCFLEDASVLEKDNGAGGNGRGPLLTIKEIMLEDGGVEMIDDSEDDTGTKAVCEYGVTIVDAVTGAVTMGQFADDVLRSRMQTLLASFGPSEVLYEGGANGASRTLISLLKSSCPHNTTFKSLQPVEMFPKSFAIDLNDRRMLERVKSGVHPWDSDEALKELHRKGYYPRSSRKNEPSSGAEGISRWPEILRSCIQGGATLALQSFGAALYYLQISLVDAEILSMGIVKPYCPPNNVDSGNDKSAATDHLQDMYSKESHQIDGRSLVEAEKPVNFGPSMVPASLDSSVYEAESNIDHMALDGRTLTNLEILNITSGGYQGSLLSKIDVTQSPHGSRLLRAWLLRPLFRKVDIDRRADVVEELAGGAVAVAMAEARPLLKKIGDIERLLSRVHSMSGGGCGEGGNGDSHPNDRAVLYEMDKYTKRKVGDFSKLLNGLRAAAEIPDLFVNAEIQSPMLEKIVRTTDENGCFPAEMKERLDWFYDNFDLKKAARGEFEPSRGMDDDYDAACNEIEDIQRELQNYKDEMCSSVLQPRNTARSSWKYINLKEDSKDKYLIELPISVQVPDDFYVKAKRGKGANQVNKYRTPAVEQLVQELERAIDVKNERKAAGMKLVFAKFDSMRSVWMAATHASAMLDALGSLAQIASQPGFCRPQIMDCPPSAKPGIEVIQGRHPCVDVTHSGGDFIPNDLALGGKVESDGDESSVLLLSGPNMGGKSTLLRQTCLITILAQVGSFVPAESCSLTPVDRIFTRLGASDRILCGQSTFFVELAETAAAVRGATRRSLVIMDELGRGTSTFDGTAIASATVQHLVERNQCLTLFATHYHSLLEDWKNEPSIRLGHMECVVEDNDNDSEKKSIAFLYTLGDGPCPKSFGVNVARLAGLPDDVLERAKRVSVAFEAEMNGETNHHKIIPSEAEDIASKIEKLFSTGAVNHDELKQIWEGLQ